MRCPASSIGRRRELPCLRAISRPDHRALFSGLVGPIFLITYFVLPNMFGSISARDLGSAGHTQNTIQWMLWLGLLITVADVLVALWLANRGAKSAVKSAALHQTGVLTMAQIQGCRDRHADQRTPGGQPRPTHRRARIRFNSHKRVTVDISKQAIVTARKLVVLVDPNTRDYEIDWQASALIAGVVPAQFTIAEDNKTYDLSGQAGPLMEILQIYKSNNLPISGTSTCARTRRCASRSWPWSGAPRRSSPRPAAAAVSPRRRSRPSPSDSRSWRNCTPAARSRTPSTPRRGRKSSPISDRRRLRPIRTRFSFAASLIGSRRKGHGVGRRELCKDGWHSSPAPRAARGGPMRPGWPAKERTSSPWTSARRCPTASAIPRPPLRIWPRPSGRWKPKGASVGPAGRHS